MAKQKITIGNLEDCARMLFPQEGEFVPKLRFKGFEGKWVEAVLGDLFTERIENDPNGEMLSVTMNNGIIKASENGRFDNSNSDKSHYKVVRVNDIAYNSMRMWQGASGCSAYDGIVSPAYTVVTPVEGIDSNFFAYLFKTPAVIKKFRLHSQGLTSDTWNLKFPAFSKITVLYPKDIEEQKLISSYLRNLDEQIALQQQQLERLKQMKQACLSSLFPDNQTFTPPRLRFKGFEGQWIMVKFCDMAHRISTSDISNELPSVEFEDIVAGEGVLNKDIYRKNVIKRGTRFDEHDVLFGKLRPYLKNILFAEFKGVAIGDFWVLRATELVDPYFLYILVSSESFMKVANVSSGSKMPRADWNLVSNSYFLTPSSIEEQRRIASFFRTLDKKISVQSHQVEKLKQLKKACLNKIIA